MVHGTREIAESLKTQVAAVIEPLGLRLAEAKTQVVHLDEGFAFLGMHIQRRRQRGSPKHYVYTYPSAKAVKAIKARVRASTNRSTTNQDLAQLLGRLNATLRGWANYFRHGVSKKIFGDVDHYAWWRTVGWLRKKHHRLTWKDMRRRFMHGWKLTADGITFTGAQSVPVYRYRYRGYRIPTPWSASAPTS